MKVLITGNAGSGKTSVAAELSRRGYAAHDADEGFGHWTHKVSGKVRYSRPAENRGDYYWLWSIDKVEQLLKEVGAGSLFFCGLASNQTEVYESFDKIVWLNCDFDVIKVRLKDRQNNPFGKRPGDLELIRKTQDTLRSKLPREKLIEVDASQPLEKVVDEILGIFA
jgi:gluconate kinase